jgi:two-component system, NtrC family, sensor kinase
VQLLMEDDGRAGPELSKRWLSHIDGESERARRIVRRLLDSVRHPKLHLQAHATDALIRSSVKLVDRQLPAGVAVHIIDAPGRILWIDRERLQQVFINLIKNAADAGAGNIWIDAEESTWAATMPDNTDYLVGEINQVSLTAGVLIIRIEDDGPGIAEEHLAQIFNPFFTTHSAGDGTGLGLYLVAEIVSEHRGCIAVENRTEGGTRFSIWLPLADDMTNEEPAAP